MALGRNEACPLPSHCTGAGGKKGFRQQREVISLRKWGPRGLEGQEVTFQGVVTCTQAERTEAGGGWRRTGQGKFLGKGSGCGKSGSEP